MSRQSLVAMVSDDLLARITSGEFPPESTLPGEQDLVAQHDVSRVTVREAVKTLEALGVARVERGRGTFVNPLNRWTSLEAVLRATSTEHDDGAAAVQLIELRKMLEVGSAALAAARISSDETEQLSYDIVRMRQAHLGNDVSLFVEADLHFHRVILQASGNVFVSVLLEPLSRILAARREQTSRLPEIQEHAIHHHTLILAALRSGDPEASRVAMDNHMAQTLDDLRALVLSESENS
ncbi:FadR/GntR family transcriptional regulator [Frondihabitans peucedani]|jgi:DNA-binding FadR family transcriptional regulator|uniref:FadR/GntR family transcriptional regulator n=1 Tax=Frondihabitans peucedani TaxID=598626 RepID=A0ABP8E572_9MICO